MYSWLAELFPDQVSDPRRFAPLGASPALLRGFREALGIELPPSYVAFLERWNGAQNFLGELVYSTDEVLEWHRDWCPFRPWSGESVACEPDGDEYYAEKPTHHLVVVSYAFDQSVLAFDTRPIEGGEYPMYLYDREDDDVTRFAFPTFEAYVLHGAYERCDGGELRARLGEILTARGGRDLDELRPDWTGWR